MKRLLFLLLALVASHSWAAVDLPLTCKVSVPNGGTCATENLACVPGKNGLLTATPSGTWRKWEDIAPVDKIRAWVNDLQPGVCSGGRHDVAKANAVAEEQLQATKLDFRWVLPTTLVTGGPIQPANPIEKVVLVYAINASIPDSATPAGGYTFVELAGTATTYTTTHNAKVGDIVYARVRVILKSGEVSDFSGEVSWTVPKLLVPASAPTGLTINGSPQLP